MALNRLPAPVSDIKIISLQSELKKLNSEVEFVLVLAGKVRLERNGSSVYLNPNDVMLISPREFPALSSSGNNLVMIVTIKKDFFQRNGITSFDHFICDSVNDKDRDYSELRKILSKLAIAHHDRAKGDDLYQVELCYALIHYLAAYHLQESSSRTSVRIDSSERMDIIEEYLEQNYMNPLSLTELAELTHLNSSYLSRFFRKTTGKTFNDYLKDIRLSHAMSDLQETDKSITSIAFENGFSTPASFCKIFAAQYNTTPSRFRRNNKLSLSEPRRDDDAFNARRVGFELVQPDLQSLAGGGAESDPASVRYPLSKRISIDSTSPVAAIKPLCGKLINLGFGMNLTNSEFQKHLKLAQDEIGFEYGRVEGLMSRDVLPPLQAGGYNFAEFDRIMITLLQAGIKPYIDLSIRGANILLPGRDEVLYRHYDIDSQSTSFLNKFEDLLKHCVNYFGTDEVNTWIFDIGIFHNEYLRLQETPREFARRAKACQDLIRSFLPDCLIGGVSYNSGMPIGTFEAIIEETRSEGFRPDFFSTCIFPYEPVEVIQANMRLVSGDKDHVKNEIIRERSVIEQYPELSGSIWLVALGVSIQTMDYANDTCFQATHFIKSSIDILGLVDAIGYYQLSDISGEYSDTSRILYGASGILSRNGLKKPGFSALKRLRQIDSRLLFKDDGMIATTNSFNSCHLIICNYSYFNEMYCISGASGTAAENAYDFFSDPGTMAYEISVNGLKPGRYKLVCVSLSREHGSLFDEWTQYGILDDLQPSDIQYLKDSVHPLRTAHYIECSDGHIAISTQLLPHETKFYSIVRVI